jgi:tetratricopeptide (TPR) repeat protein
LVFLAVALAAGTPLLLLAQTPVLAVPEPPVTPEARAEIAGYADMARRAAARGDLEIAEQFYNKLLIVNAPDSEKKNALLDMFEYYRTKHIYSKAIAVGERVHQLFPGDPAVPDLLLKLGQVYRDTGAYQLAIARFYNVLNATLRIDQEEFLKYKGLSTKAQFEIADTFMMSGDYKQAARMYSLLDRLELSSPEKAEAEFQFAYCSFLLADYSGAVTSAKRFLEAFGASDYAPQCHYVLSMALKALQRPQEAADETLTLLRMEKKAEQTDANTWIYWQKKTGNQLANEFYQQGDFLRALTIYQALAKLSEEPAWQFPIIYQVGLCFERLRFPDRAIEAYSYISDESKKSAAAGKPVSADLAELSKMAEWRSAHLEWQQSAEGQVNALLGARAPAEDEKVTPAP